MEGACVKQGLNENYPWVHSLKLLLRPTVCQGLQQTPQQQTHLAEHSIILCTKISRKEFFSNIWISRSNIVYTHTRLLEYISGGQQQL